MEHVVPIDSTDEEDNVDDNDRRRFRMLWTGVLVWLKITSCNFQLGCSATIRHPQGNREQGEQTLPSKDKENLPTQIPGTTLLAEDRELVYLFPVHWWGHWVQSRTRVLVERTKFLDKHRTKRGRCTTTRLLCHYPEKQSSPLRKQGEHKFSEAHLDLPAWT